MRLPLSLVALNVGVLAAGVVAIGAVGTVAPDGPAALAQGGTEDPRPAVTASASQAVATAAAPATSAAAAPPAGPTAVPGPSAAPARPPAAEPQPAPIRRTVSRTGYSPYATVGPVTLHFPGDVVEVVGLHQSGHDGAQPQSPVEGPARIGRLDSRERDTNPQGAADIVLDPARQVRAPVTGTVLRAGSYTLYCDHVDQYLVVEPDAQPGWEVKMLHFEGLAVGKGDRVQGGVTVVGSRARVLPFESQVDEHTAAPHWPHVHVEVVDPSIPDRPSGGSCD